MDTNEAIRQRVLSLIDQGVSQKVLATKMGVSQTWLSRWVNQKGDRPLVLTVAAMDGLSRYVAALTEALQEAQRVTTPTAGETFQPADAGASRIHERVPADDTMAATGRPSDHSRR